MIEQSTFIFCHYGVSAYLQYTLRQVKYSNPNARVILLGDEFNQSIAKKEKVEHFLYEDYSSTDEIKRFDAVYQHVAGVDHGREFWTKFVFKRWFHIHDFIVQEGINSFWHFDSDNMILADLSYKEKDFVNYDCTEQCNGTCMNGFISSSAVVAGYLNKINTLFVDEEYLSLQRADFLKHPSYGFTEMRAYKAYKEQETINSIKLITIINNETFDDCICQQYGYETYEKSINGHFLKKKYVDKNNNFYCYNNEKKEFVKMLSFNLSWVPTELFEIVHNVAVGKSIVSLIKDDDDKYLIDISPLFLDRKKKFRMLAKKVIPHPLLNLLRFVKERRI